MKAPVATSIAIAVGLVILVGYFIPFPILQDVRTILLGWAVILTGVATLIGILNLLAVHWNKFRRSNGRDIYSLFLIMSFVITFGIGLWLTPMNPQFQHVVTSIQIPVESSLMAILAITLIYTSLRLLKQRRGIMSIVFIISTLLFLVVLSDVLLLFGDSQIIRAIVNLLNKLPLAGARGILLGIALGSLTTGLRILLGVDRPYSG